MSLCSALLRCVWVPWWRHEMETFSALLALCAGNSLVSGELPAQRPVTQSFDVFFDLRLNKRLSKQMWGWWLETPSRSLWRHYNVVQVDSRVQNHKATSTVYWCIASKLKAARNLYWISNMFLWVEIFLFFVCYHVFPKMHSQLDYELNDL